MMARALEGETAAMTPDFCFLRGVAAMILGGLIHQRQRQFTTSTAMTMCSVGVAAATIFKGVAASIVKSIWEEGVTPSTFEENKVAILEGLSFLCQHQYSTATLMRSPWGVAAVQFMRPALGMAAVVASMATPWMAATLEGLGFLRERQRHFTTLVLCHTMQVKKLRHNRALSGVVAVVASMTLQEATSMILEESKAAMQESPVPLLWLLRRRQRQSTRSADHAVAKVLKGEAASVNLPAKKHHGSEDVTVDTAHEAWI